MKRVENKAIQDWLIAGHYDNIVETQKYNVDAFDWLWKNIGVPSYCGRPLGIPDDWWSPVWTYLHLGDGATAYFFKDEKLAVEFKLRFG